MCEKVNILSFPTETIGKGFRDHQLLLVALQCGKQTGFAELLADDPPKSHHTITIVSLSQPRLNFSMLTGIAIIFGNF